MPPGSATVLLATRYLLPPGRPRANGRWPVLSAHSMLPAPPTTAGRECGSEGKVPDVPPVDAPLLSPGSHVPHAVRPPFHNEGRNPARSMPHQGSRVGGRPSRHTSRLVPTAQPQHSACTAAKGRSREMVRGLTSLPRLLPLLAYCLPLPTVARLDTYSPAQGEGPGSLWPKEGSAQGRRHVA